MASSFFYDRRMQSTPKRHTATLTATVTAAELHISAPYEADIDPMQGVLVMLGKCSLITLHGILMRQRQTIRQYRITLDATRGRDVPHLFTHIDSHIQLIGTALQSNKCEQALHIFTKYCPVHQQLSARTTIAHTWHITAGEQ